ncbi:MAG: epoxyqueuosine reductase [Firmicutes bacterium]|jgi:epoxyqueuosine reductase|nr:epoxyqueuosine reductase [Bacillota bacterium]
MSRSVVTAERAWFELENKLREWGADLCGVADLTGLVPKPYQELTRGISLAVKLSDVIVDELLIGPTLTYYQHYETVNQLLDQIAHRLSRELEKRGARALPVPSSQVVDTENLRGLFQHKTAATRAGLGWIGRSALLVTPEFGPRVRLATVITDLPLPVGEPIVESRCGECHACLDACPGGAVVGEKWALGKAREEIYNARRCLDWKAEHYRHIAGGKVCGVCVRVCPWGKSGRTDVP